MDSIKLTPIRGYMVDGLGEFLEVSRWEGFVKLRERGGPNVLIVTDESPTEGIIDFLARDFGDKAMERSAVVIKASPLLASKLKEQSCPDGPLSDHSEHQ